MEADHRVNAALDDQERTSFNLYAGKLVSVLIASVGAIIYFILDNKFETSNGFVWFCIAGGFFGVGVVLAVIFGAVAFLQKEDIDGKTGCPKSGAPAA